MIADPFVMINIPGIDSTTGVGLARTEGLAAKPHLPWQAAIVTKWHGSHSWGCLCRSLDHHECPNILHCSTRKGAPGALGYCHKVVFVRRILSYFVYK